VTDGAHRAAYAFTLALAALLLVTGAVDPSGFIALVGFSGWHPVKALWWWAPYLIYAPLLLLLCYAGARAALAGSLTIPRRRVAALLWMIGVLSAGAAESVYALALLLAEIRSGHYVLPFSGSAAFLVWASGYAALKMALLAPLPALAGARAFVPPRLMTGSPPAELREASAMFVAGGACLFVALFGPWLGHHWWRGSPVGYIYKESTLLLAPVPGVGIPAVLLALLVLAATCWLYVREQLRTTAREASALALFLLGARAAVASATALFLAQLALLLAGRATAHDHDGWWTVAALLRAVEAGSFALVLAVPMGLLALVAVRRSVRRGPGSIGALLVAAAVSTLIALVVPPGTRRIDQEPAAARSSHGDMARLSVHHGAPAYIEGSGAQVTLRGVNVNQLSDYYRADPALPGAEPLTESDFADIAALGMNAVRLTLSWSLLEPRSGEYSVPYLDRVREAVGWAKRHHLYVVLDIHQDAWGASVAAPRGTRCRWGTEPMTGWDGAPAWATLTDGAAPCMFTGRDLAANVSRAFESFYFDRDGVQSELVLAWAVLAKSFAAEPAVAGYELLNEPNFAESPPITSTLLLANFHARAIAAIRAAERSVGAGYAHLVIVEPSIFWSGFGLDNLPPRNFSHDPGVVFSPHLYNESITVDQNFGARLISIERGFRLAQTAADELSAPLWIGEWGYFDDPAQQAGERRRQARVEDEFAVGSAVWVWRQACGDPHVYPGRLAGNIRRASCPGGEPLETIPATTVDLRRAYARSAPGMITSLDSNGTKLRLSGTRSGEACGLEIWVPGDTRPRIAESKNVGALTASRVEPGSPLLGPSGGWLLTGCVTGEHYELETQ
jgi:hypothetical protein